MTREHLLKILPDAMIIRGVPAERSKAILDACSLSELHNMYHRQVSAGHIKPDAPPQAPPSPPQEDVWDTIERTDVQLAEIRAEREANNIWHKHETQQAREPQRRAEAEAQLVKDRETFAEACRQYGLSDIEANFSLTKSVLGSGFDVYQVGQALNSNALQLVAATPQELEQWRAEAVQERQDYLINQASPLELRAAARQESEQRRTAWIREEDQRQVAAREQKDAITGFPELPATNSSGEPLNSVFFKKLSNTNLDSFRRYIKTFGASQITRALRDRV